MVTMMHVQTSSWSRGHLCQRLLTLCTPQPLCLSHNDTKGTKTLEQWAVIKSHKEWVLADHEHWQAPTL